MKEIRWRWRIEWRWPRLAREFIAYPKLDTPPRPEAEHLAADPNKIPAWREDEQSDNLETRK